MFAGKGKQTMEYGLVETAVNGGLTIKEYREGIRFGTDALLLAHFASERLGKGVCADFGTGSGVLPLLLSAAGCKCDFLAVELQEKYAALARENALANGFGEKISVLQGDLREYRTLFPAGSLQAVVSNPPYLPAGSGKQNLAVEKRTAWHDDTLPAESLAQAAAWGLSTGGKFFCVYLPSRMAGLMDALKKNRLEPKRLQLVVPAHGEPPSLLLLEARKDGAEGLEILPELPLYTDATRKEESPQLLRIKNFYKLFED